MRLLNTHSLKLKSFFGDDIPPYAILSHTWGKTEDEVTFQDMMAEGRSVAKGKAGYKKIRRACQYAQKYMFKWIWIDSCCINKESSAELSEALNSMYAHYEDAQVCYVYLEDAVCSEDIRDAGSEFRHCKWFTRGWTLQELLAPSYVVFLDQDWKMIGTRYSLADVISAITSIPVSVFRDGDFDKFSVAQKMSWAAPRQTTRPEDMAYCLLGIFRVSMSPIYGEGGARAFMRLQQEIINISDDRSIFAWVAPYGENGPRGLLARSPAEFRISGEVKASEADDIGDASFLFGNNGLRIHLPLVPIEPVSVVVSETANTQRPSYPVGTIFSAPLHCCSERGPETCFAVYLQKVAGERYVRCRPDELAIIPGGSQQPDICQVVVKENAGIPRKVKNDLNVTCLSIRNTTPGVFLRDSHLETGMSMIPDPHEDKEVQGMKETSVKINYWPGVNIGWGTWPVARLKYQCLMSDDFFHVDLGFNCTDGSLRFALRQWHFGPLTWSDDSCWDWMEWHLEDAGLVSITYHMTGDQTLRIFELRYVAPNKAKASSISGPLEPFRLGFMVPSMIREKVESNFLGKTYKSQVFQLANVFPPDFFGKEHTDQTYVDMSALWKRERFRVLTYTAPSNTYPRGTTRAYVVIGFHESTAWMDIVVSTDSPEEVWKSYCDSGWRAPTRIQCSPDATLDLLPRLDKWSIKWPKLTGNVKERSSLQLGSHVLSVNHFIARYDLLI
ncbi:hypothetical protein D9758_013440 [Tetrapyrgos nigripes]|uniref:Heterokaryon incompatibility domain-containing protein n=1 Tax=Tetrapyrgos nigripes TaxID=182062 RepID=A0A8H5CLV5_9AGAR|nr:hypothetical protein D9758_013440 [Tetrapyrgos nigripes]